MKTKTLSAYGVGDCPQWLADDGLELAVRYFEEKDIDPVECFTAKQSDPNGDMSACWDEAEKIANRVLLGDERYDNSMITLEIEEVDDSED